MTSQAKIDANRRNAQHSTGPRTTEGKARSSLNALKHGLRSRSFILSQTDVPTLHEDADKFSAHLQGLIADLKPEGALEETCVETIAFSLWRLVRLDRAEIGQIAWSQKDQIGDGTPGYRARVSVPYFKTIELFMRYEAHLTRQLRQASHDLRKLQAERKEAEKAEREREDKERSQAPSPNTPKGPNKATPFSRELARALVSMTASPSESHLRQRGFNPIDQAIRAVLAQHHQDTNQSQSPALQPGQSPLSGGEKSPLPLGEG
jgi:hypothetical protein